MRKAENAPIDQQVWITRAVKHDAWKGRRARRLRQRMDAWGYYAHRNGEKIDA